MHHLYIFTLLALSIYAGELDAFIISPSNDKSSAANGLSNEVDTKPRLKSVNETRAANQSDNSSAEEISQAEIELYWLNRRDHFFNQTTFSLDKVSVHDKASFIEMCRN